jgi:8-oxoguanine deaminase
MRHDQFDESSACNAASLLIRNADVLVTMDKDRREILGGNIYVENGKISAVGTLDDMPSRAIDADEILDLRGHVVIPGLVNTHHHMDQTLLRVMPAGQDLELFGWLQALYRVWRRLTPAMIETSALTAMAELILSGCTTSSDHAIYPRGCAGFDVSIAAAKRIGLRFHMCRGGQSLGTADGGGLSELVVEDEDAILKDTQRLIERYHDGSRYAMVRVAVAPSAPFEVSRDLMRESAKLARHHGVMLHTHLAENLQDVAYCRERFSMTPAQYAEDVGWVGPDVWHAHCVHLDDAGIDLFANTGTGVSHCPSSNMRLASGIAPVHKMCTAGVPVSFGVDGSASNDGAQMFGELRQALLLQRVAFGSSAMSARHALEIATLGGARVLGRDDIGAIAEGMAADLVAVNLNSIQFAGALHDPVAALVFCSPPQVAYSVINGRVIVREGELTTLETASAIELHNQYARELMDSI